MQIVFYAIQKNAVLKANTAFFCIKQLGFLILLIFLGFFSLVFIFG